MAIHLRLRQSQIKKFKIKIFAELTSKLPNHKRSIGATDSDQASHAIQETCASNCSRVDLSFCELGSRGNARISEQSEIAFSITASDHIVASRPRSSRDESVLRRVVPVAPHSSHREANSAIVCQPLDIFHRDRASLSWKRFDIPEQKVKINGRRLQVVRI